MDLGDAVSKLVPPLTRAIAHYYTAQKCPMLAGKHVRQKIVNAPSVAGVRGSPTRVYYHQSDLLDIAAGLKAYAGNDPTEDETIAEYDCPRQTLYAWEKGCAYLDGQPLTPIYTPELVERVRKGKTHRVLIHRKRYKREQLDKIKAVMALGSKVNETPGYMSNREAETTYRIPQPRVSDWRNKPCPHLDGKTISAKRFKTTLKGRGGVGNRLMMVWKSPVAELEQIARSMGTISEIDPSAADQESDATNSGDATDTRNGTVATLRTPDLPTKISGPDLARVLGLPRHRVVSALRRFAENNPDCMDRLENQGVTRRGSFTEPS